MISLVTCSMNLLQQLKILCCCYKIKKVSGYVFPKLPNKDGKCMNKTIVTRVDVQWESLEFRVSFVHLPKLDVAEDVCKVHISSYHSASELVFQTSQGP